MEVHDTIGKEANKLEKVKFKHCLFYVWSYVKKVNRILTYTSTQFQKRPNHFIVDETFFSNRVKLIESIAQFEQEKKKISKHVVLLFFVE